MGYPVREATTFLNPGHVLAPYCRLFFTCAERDYLLDVVDHIGVPQAHAGNWPFTEGGLTGPAFIGWRVPNDRTYFFEGDFDGKYGVNHPASLHDAISWMVWMRAAVPAVGSWTSTSGRIMEFQDNSDFLAVQGWSFIFNNFQVPSPNGGLSFHVGGENNVRHVRFSGTEFDFATFHDYVLFGVADQTNEADEFSGAYVDGMRYNYHSKSSTLSFPSGQTGLTLRLFNRPSLNRNFEGFLESVAIFGADDHYFDDNDVKTLLRNPNDLLLQFPMGLVVEKMAPSLYEGHRMFLAS